VTRFLGGRISRKRFHRETLDACYGADAPAADLSLSTDFSARLKQSVSASVEQAADRGI
jgi:hypothetical protein